MPDETTAAEQQPLTTEPINEGLERDLRAVMGLDESSEAEAPPDGQDDPSAQPKTPETKAPETEPEYEIDGEKFTARQIREWRMGHLRMDDYTRKTQSVAEERRQLEQMRGQLAPLQQVEQFLRQNPHIAQVIQQQLREEAGALAPQVPVPNPAQEQLATVQEQLAEMQLDRDLATLRQTVNAERTRMGLDAVPDAEWDDVANRVMETAVQSGITDLGQAFRLSPLRDEWTTAALEAARKAAAEQQRAQARQAAGAVMGGSPRGAGAPQVAAPPKDLAEATRRSFQELKSQGVSLFTND